MSDNLHNFYSNKSILLTGGTGFVGLAILEKVLRTFPDVSNVYLIIRAKGNHSLMERKELLLKNPVFNRLKEEYARKGGHVNFSMLRWIQGDLEQPNLGLSYDTIKQLQEDVNIIIHCAATIRFMEPLKTAITVNVASTEDLLKIAQGCKHLQGFIYVSSTYSQATKSTKIVREAIREHPMRPKDLINYASKMTLHDLNEKTAEILGDLVNTYTYTKNAAENLVYSYSNSFLVCIYRLGAVVYAYREPVPYWLGCNVGFPRILMEAHRGYVLDVNPKLLGKFVPVDLAINGLLAATFDVIQNQKSEIYNYTAEHNPLEVQKMFDSYVSAIENYESELIPFRERMLALLRMKHRPQLNETGEKILSQLVKAEEIAKLYKFFLHTPFQFENNKINSLWDKMSDNDKILCPFDLRQVDWQDFYKHAYHKSNGTTKVSQFPLKGEVVMNL